MDEAFVIGVDVGTTSARAGVYDTAGRMLGRSQHPIRINRPSPEHAEHSSTDIWQAVGIAVRGAMAAAGVPAEAVRGISFDATCSLVVLDAQGQPVDVSSGPEPGWDTIVWLDHRAVAEAEACSRSGHRVLDFIGGVMSPEMETPKLMWLKRHKPESWQRAGLFLDLADFLTFRASGSTARSACTITCKWTYLAHETPGWQQDFFAAMGVADLVERGGLPAGASAIGSDLGALLPEAAEALGLTTAVRVGAGLIDAHAGALGVLGALGREPAELDRHLGLIAGTSSCHMALSREPRAVPGVWGPYLGAVLPGYWLNEGGQSVTGALLDHILQLHSAGGAPDAALHARIVERIAALQAAEGPSFAAGLHVLPDFHGNRSPLADPHATGVISGLTLDRSFDGLCRLYYRTAVGIVLGTRHIIEALNAKGYRIDTLHLTGGHVKNPLLVGLYADGTGCRLVLPETEDAVLLGTAMVAATAAGLHADLPAACAAMAPRGRERLPEPEAAARLARDYRAFLLMHEQRRALDALA
ncbi:MAG: FGGY-family carbohydrate kinase [Geminicoccaceae bacterium]